MGRGDRHIEKFQAKQSLVGLMKPWKNRVMPPQGYRDFFDLMKDIDGQNKLANDLLRRK